MPAVSSSEELKRATPREIPVDPAEDTALHCTLAKTWQRVPGVIGWVSTANHKETSMRWIVSAFIFFLLAGVLALAMRIQLARPENHFLSADRYNQFFTVHG